MAITDAYHAVIATPLGPIGLRMSDGSLSSLDYLPTDAPERPAMDTATEAIVAQLKAYFCDPNFRFSISPTIVGTAFQRQVWAALQEIPPGTVLTYGELARQLKTAARAIGGACRTNPIPIVVPCHRVVGRQGLGGYAGEMTGDPLAIKRWLLQHEGVTKDSRLVHSVSSSDGYR